MSPSYAQIDRLLGTEPQFGSAEAIEARNLARYRLGLTVLARHFPAAADRFERLGALEDAALRPFLYDPVLRNAFEDDLLALEHRRSEPGELARQLTDPDLDAGDGLGPSERLMAPHCRPWAGRGVGWVWTDPRPGAAELPLAGRLEELREGSFAELRGARRVVPDAGQLAGLGRGAELLAALLPHAGAGVFPHISLVGLARGASEDGELHSLSGGDPLPSALFIAPEHLDDPWMTAEILLHEGLHLKEFDVLRTGSLVAEPGHQVEIPWRLTPWTLTRVLAALHVYSHMVLFFAAAAEAPAELRERFGPPPATEAVGVPTPGSRAAVEGGYTTSAERAGYLGRQALELHGGALTPAGRRFVRWLLDAVAPLAPGVRGPAVAAAAAVAAVPDPPVLDPRGYRKVEPVAVCPLPEQQQLLAFAPESARFHWLNEHAWLIYALCDGGSTAELEAAYAEQTGGPADARLALGVAGLVAAGLVRPVGD
ncbi:HEXXH motif-containing putative peptide modification protein [Kitasatospora sp. NPDC002040]|uniref:aKG-HExxH-type peptide beta-hydroxylase n=1 Tax=Kitasatospora sp. NPDC002040 TaxID=3154661 RepID=UPI003319C9F4